MKPFCEIIVQNVLPVVRALVAKDLTERHKLTQQSIAKKLGVSQAAISQYIRELRGFKAKNLQRDKTVTDEIEKLSSRIASGDLNVLSATDEMCNICRTIRKKKLICELHVESFPSLEKCTICLEKSPC